MKKQIRLGIILSFIGQMISIIVGLTYSPIMIRILNQSEYGLYQLIQSVVNYINLMNFGLTGAYIRYYSAAKKKGEDEVANINGLFLRVFTVLSIISLLIGVVLYFNIGMLGDKITTAEYAKARVLLIIMVINMAISFPSSLFTVFINANERFIFQKTVGIIINVLMPILNIPLLLLGKGSIGVVSITLFLSILRFVFTYVYSKKKLGMRIHYRYFEKAVFFDLFRFTFFIFLSDIVDQLGSNVDKFLLGRMKGTVAVAIFSVGFTFKTYLTMTTWIVPEMFVPEVNRLVVNKEKDEKLTDLWTKVGKINNFIVLLPLTGFILIGKEFVQLWVGDGYEISYYAGMVLMASGYIGSLQTLGINIQDAKNKHQIRSVVLFIVALLNIAISIWFIKMWGVVGTCLGTLVASVAGAIFMNFYYKLHIGLNVMVFWKETIKWTIPAAIYFGIAYFVMRYVQIENWGGIVIFAVVYSAVYCVLLWFIGLNKGQRNKAVNFVKKRLGKATV